MRRGRYLQAREEQIAIRRLNRGNPLGWDIIHRSVKAVVSLRIYSSQSTDFKLGTTVSQEQYAVNIKPPIDKVIAGDNVVMFLEDFSDESISEAMNGILTVKSVGLGVKITRLNCVEPGGK